MNSHKEFNITKPKLQTILISLFLFLIFLNYYLLIYKDISIRYWDEYAWIGRSYYFDFLIKGDIHNFHWQSYYAVNQPKLAEYLYGALLYPKFLSQKEYYDNDYIKFLIDNNFYEITSMYYHNYKQKSNFINWGLDPDKAIYLWGPLPQRQLDSNADELILQYGNDIIPTIEIINTARAGNTIILTLTVVITFLLTRRISSLITALLTSIMFGMNFLFITSGLRAHSEGLFVLLFLTTTYLLVLTVTSKKDTLLLSLLTGISTALLTQTKLNGIMLFFFVNGTYLIILLKNFYNKDLFSIQKKLIGIFLFNSTCIILFIALHPYLYPNPIENTLTMYRIRYQQAQEQASQYPSQKLPTYSDRITSVYSNFIFDSEKHCHFNGQFFLHERFCMSAVSFYMKVILFFGGTVIFLNKIRRNVTHPRVLIFTCFLFINLMASFYLLLNWDRYYVHFIYFMILFQVVAVTSILQFATKRYKNNQLYKALFRA